MNALKDRLCYKTKKEKNEKLKFQFDKSGLNVLLFANIGTDGGSAHVFGHSTCY